MSENEFFHEINVTELRDGITSLHGIHENVKFCHCPLLHIAALVPKGCIASGNTLYTYTLLALEQQ